MSVALASSSTTSHALPAKPSPQRLARTTGWLYLVLAGLGMLGPLMLESLVVPGDASATADSIAQSLWLLDVSLVAWIAIIAVDVVLSVALYLLLAPAGRALSLAAAAFRLVYSAVVGALLILPFIARALLTGGSDDAVDRQAQALAALEAFDVGFLLALVFFGFHLLVLGPLLLRSRYVPRVFGVLLSVAGAGYITDSLLHLITDAGGGPISAVLLTPAVIGEIGLAVWLLIKGVQTPNGKAPDL
ncbi:DUF4386 domain-containing protein [Rhodococcus sp. NPDC049939]|uniref:DUF4386 domain-containing protein n=1 Tax=Rhodococcus sp. NPDC049939 TaxID=3155511 RepID=UPI003410E669